MLLKRLLLAAISLIIGTVVTYLIAIFLLETTVAEFWTGPEEPVNIPYFVLTAFFIACAAGIWLDKFMGTELLPK